MGDNYYVKTFSGVPNPPDEEIMKVCSMLKRFCGRVQAGCMHDARTRDIDLVVLLLVP